MPHRKQPEAHDSPFSRPTYLTLVCSRYKKRFRCVLLPNASDSHASHAIVQCPPPPPMSVRELYPIPRRFVSLSSGRSWQQNPTQKQAPSSAQPWTTASTAATAATAAATSNLKNVNRPERRFAGYKLASIREPLQRGGGSRGGAWGRNGSGKDWLRDYLKKPRRPGLEVTDSVIEGV